MAGGQAVVFSDIRPEAKAWPVKIVKVAKWFLGNLKVPAVCVASPDIPGSERLLQSLGWRWLKTTEQGEVYAWLPQD